VFSLYNLRAIAEEFKQFARSYLPDWEAQQISAMVASNARSSVSLYPEDETWNSYDSLKLLLKIIVSTLIWRIVHRVPSSATLYILADSDNVFLSLWENIFANLLSANRTRIESMDNDVRLLEASLFLERGNCTVHFQSPTPRVLFSRSQLCRGELGDAYNFLARMLHIKFRVIHYSYRIVGDTTDYTSSDNNICVWLWTEFVYVSHGLDWIFILFFFIV